MNEELVVLENLNAVEVFVAGGTDKLLQAIRDEVINDVPDVTTAKGRKEIASRAHKVGKSSVAIDKMGKDLKAKYQEKITPIDAERKKSKDTLKALKIEVREPLTNWEDAEVERVEKLKRRLSLNFEYSFENFQYVGISLVKEALENAENTVIDDTWQEFKEEAAEAKPVFIEKITDHLNRMVKEAAAEAELERLKKAEEDRKQKEREEKIAKDAAAKAEAEKVAAIAREEEAKKQAARDVEAAEAREKQGIEDAKARLKAAENKAVEDQKAAEIKAEADKIAAIEVERQRVAAEEQAKIDAEKARAKNTEHKREIHKDILLGLKELNIDEDLAKSIITAIAKGKIKNVTINY